MMACTHQRHHAMLAMTITQHRRCRGFAVVRLSLSPMTTTTTTTAEATSTGIQLRLQEKHSLPAHHPP